MERDAEIGGASGPIDDHGRADDDRVMRPHRGDRLLHRATGGHDVVDDQHPLAPRELKSASERAAGSGLIPFGVHGTQRELSRDLVREDDAARRRTRDGLGCELPGPLGDRRAQALGLRWPLQHLELLQIAGRVPAR